MRKGTTIPSRALPMRIRASCDGFVYSLNEGMLLHPLVLLQEHYRFVCP